MEMSGSGDKFSKISGVTLLEALMATAVVAIGFIAVFQMVNYSVQSIDSSSERTKANFLVSMVAEDLISDKNSLSRKDGNKNIYFKDELIDGKVRDSDFKSWKFDCSKTVASDKKETAYANKTEVKWKNRLSKKRLKCRGDKDLRFLKVFDICSDKPSSKKNCKFKNSTNEFYENSGDSLMLIGKMQVQMNNGNIKKSLYFQID
jgi:Tfp pilus assembly protein PilV|tara:strand:+ start:5398 stop:6009 length:612 start_codon:yes stop_codon:yes gene_type:complete